MAIIDDYAAIATELRRIKTERLPEKDSVDVQGKPEKPQHRMRTTIAGDLLYQRLVLRRRR